ncbi:MAG: hypothetical protein LAT54_09840, partial [Cryomorphaceae bacterium]|nr:hypothetical protein [Cryomorphaceae bacterium]
MKRLYTSILFVLSTFFLSSTSYAQILTPDGAVQGDSENNNVNIGPNTMPDARLRIEPSEEFG